MEGLLYRIQYINAEIDKYVKFQNDVKAVIPVFSPAINSITNCSNDIKCFLIDQKSADNGSFDNSKSNVESILNSINNDILPAIAQKISSLHNEIYNINLQIEAIKRASKKGGK